MSKKESTENINNPIEISGSKFTSEFTMDKGVMLNNSGGELQDFLSNLEKKTEDFQNDFFEDEEKVVKIDFTKNSK